MLGPCRSALRRGGGAFPRGSARRIFTSAPRRGQEKADLEMGERAAVRTNKLLGKISDMYVGKTVGGGGRKYAANYERVFGDWQEATFREGPMGLEISWSVPPLVTSVLPGGAAEAAGVRAGQSILAINGEDATRQLPESRIDELMPQRPLTLRLSRKVESSLHSTAARAVGRRGVAKVQCALDRERASALRDFVLAERGRCLAEAEAKPSLSEDFFSEVQTPRGVGEDVTRWDMKLPLAPEVRAALQQILSGPLGEGFEALAGGIDAELWELGAVVSEPGAAAQPVHFDAPSRCLFTSFVALQDVTQEMGPTCFLPGTHTEEAHRRFQEDARPFLESGDAASALLQAGDSVLYDSRVLHWGGANNSRQTRVQLYITFRDPAADVSALGIEQHSIRKELAGRLSLADFREPR